MVVDVHYDFLPGEALAVSDGDAMVAPIDALSRPFRRATRMSCRRRTGIGRGKLLARACLFCVGHAGSALFESIARRYAEQNAVAGPLWPDHRLQGTRGSEWARALEASGSELVIRKRFHPDVDICSAFCETARHTRMNLADYPRDRGCTGLSCVGLATDLRVLWTALHAVEAGRDYLRDGRTPRYRRR